MKKYLLIIISILFVVVGLLEIFNIIELDKLQNVIRFILISIFLLFLTYNRKKTN
jgi:hypothetical protein